MPSLHWLNKAQAKLAATKVPHHLLSMQSVHGESKTENLLIHGDNLKALKALLPTHRGRVKCIFIDPPYNTKSAFTHYSDKLEHTQWLTMMYPRLELLHALLSEDGSIWVTIDDNEAHYLKVLMDEVFLRGNFVANVVWQKRTSSDNRLRLGDAHDHILVYKKNNAAKEFFNQLPINLDRAKDFKNPDDDPRGAWASTDFTGMTGHATPNQFYTVISPNGTAHPPPEGRCWALSETTFLKLIADNRVWFGKAGSARPRLKRYLSEMEGQNSWSWWTNAEVGHNQEAKKEVNDLFGASDAFATPKPERLIQRILNIATNPGDLILDSFLGSGTTAAVAHKMGRSWIGIEMGDHAISHCLPRLQKVTEGEQGGISKTVNWRGGGGFKFLKLGNAVFDDLGRVHSDVQFADMATFVWQQETGTSALNTFTTPYLGEHGGIAYFLLFNGILGDKRPDGGNVLTYEVLDALNNAHPFAGPRVVFGEACKVPPTFRARERLIFKKIPYSLRGQGAV